MKTLLTAIMFVIALTCGLHASADKTSRGKLRVNSSMVDTNSAGSSLSAGFDTIVAPAPGEIMLKGYDKPLNSRKESLFVSNSSCRDITALKIKLVYCDLSGRTLHETEREIRAEIPAGATRRVEFPSWDTQNSFYYHLGRRPRVDNVTPYAVTCTVVSYVALSAE